MRNSEIIYGVLFPIQHVFIRINYMILKEIFHLLSAPDNNPVRAMKFQIFGRFIGVD